ncbi:hypothetical protein CF640_36835 [Burkholderia pseudomallei]|nr:hypothetical protein CF640_36835 [Burkholderia pseudomallei]
MLVASGEYLARDGTRTTPDDIAKHGCLRLDTPASPAGEAGVSSRRHPCFAISSGVVRVPSRARYSPDATSTLQPVPQSCAPQTHSGRGAPAAHDPAQASSTRLGPHCASGSAAAPHA